MRWRAGATYILSKRLEDADGKKRRQYVKERHGLRDLLVRQLKVVGDGAESDKEVSYQGLMGVERQLSPFVAMTMPFQRGIGGVRG